MHLVSTLQDIPRLGHFARGRVDLRSHRKIVVIDNRLAFCGSQNCADPEFRVKEKFAPWVDVLPRCEEPIARQAQHLFLTTWIAETGIAETAEAPYALPAADPAPHRARPQRLTARRRHSRSCYPDLLASGVRVYEYPLGLLHTKSITVDDDAWRRSARRTWTVSALSLEKANRPTTSNPRH